VFVKTNPISVENIPIFLSVANEEIALALLAADKKISRADYIILTMRGDKQNEFLLHIFVFGQKLSPRDRVIEISYLSAFGR